MLWISGKGNDAGVAYQRTSDERGKTVPLTIRIQSKEIRRQLSAYRLRRQRFNFFHSFFFPFLRKILNC